MKYAIVLIFIIVFSGFNRGYYVGSPIENHLLFNFSHGGWIHLILNSLAYIGVFRMLEKTVDKWWIILFSLCVATAMSLFTMYSIPTMGASGMIYAMIGMWLAEIINGKLKIVDKRMFYVYIFSVVLALSMSLINHHSNFKLHVLCLVAGLVFSIRRFGK